ncbi:MAG: hypothetical protein ACK5JR_00270 [Tropicimonas sp.]|uniref:hypothetical protein n=1 Tax=Tropicimonas sp. TaxID=2067044 RepID=UPI003A8B9A36
MLPKGAIPAILLVAALLCHAETLRAEALPRAAGSLFRAHGAIVAVTRTLPATRALPPPARGAAQAPERLHAASLFMGRSEASLFAPPAPRERAGRATAPGAQTRLGLTGSHAELIRHIIGLAESRRHGYDAVQHGAKRRPPGPPTTLTIGDIYDWIEATPGQHHAIGRYQFIPATLKRLVNELGVHRGARFTPDLQDRLADQLLMEAGFQRFLSGALGRHQFMNNLAKIWAGLPTTSGKSHYHGFAGNRATMSWAQFDAEMSRIFPG